MKRRYIVPISEIRKQAQSGNRFARVIQTELEPEG